MTMYPDRPNVEEFINLVDVLADEQDTLNRLEYQYNQAVSSATACSITTTGKYKHVFYPNISGVDDIRVALS